jgi:hypothetical protein
VSKTMTDTGATWGTTQYIGCTVVCGNRYGNIISHTGTVLTIDQWYDPTSSTGASGSTPGATTAYVILPGALPSAYMGITANASAVGSGDTTLPGEITTVGGGLIRKRATITRSAGASTGTVAATYTANGSDSLSVVIAKMGISPSIKSTVNQLLQTLLSSTATLTASGDQVAITDTITG